MKPGRPTLEEDPIFGGTPNLVEIACAAARKRYRLERELEKLVSTAAVAVLEALPEHDPTKSPLRPWLIRVATVAILAEERTRLRVGRRECERLPVEERAPPADCADVESLLTLAATGRGRGELSAAYAALTPNAQYIIELHLVAERSFAQIAVAIGCSERSARTRYAEAVAEMRAVFARQGDVERPAHLLDPDGALFPEGSATRQNALK